MMGELACGLNITFKNILILLMCFRIPFFRFGIHLANSHHQHWHLHANHQANPIETSDLDLEWNPWAVVEEGRWCILSKFAYEKRDLYYCWDPEKKKMPHMPLVHESLLKFLVILRRWLTHSWYRKIWFSHRGDLETLDHWEGERGGVYPIWLHELDKFRI